MFKGKENENMSKDREYEINNQLNLTQQNEIVKGLADGEQTILGERGVMLSGGDTQKLAIARVLVNNPKIVLIDERNSSLDGKSDRQLGHIMQTIMKNKEFTTVVIADRMSTVKAADSVLYLNDGYVENDSHEAFMKRSKR